jgi:uncharacterized membrane protein YebE (DUF533 family)
MAPGFVTELVRAMLGRQGAPNPDGGAPAIEAFAVVAAQETTEAPEKEPEREGEYDPGVVGVLAEKVLNAWLRNRHQLMFPFVLDLRRLERKDMETVVHAMVAAAEADGSVDGNERRRIETALGLDETSDVSFLDEALRRPKPLSQILAGAPDVKIGALVYAAALMAVDRSRPVNRYYLKYLAARLQLPDELVESLKQRFRPAH